MPPARTQLLICCLLPALAGGCLPGPGGRRPTAHPDRPPVKPSDKETDKAFRIDVGTLPVDVRPINPTRYYAEFGDLFLLGHCNDQWQAMSPTVDFLRQGAKTRVDTDLGKIGGKSISVRRGSKRPWDIIGDGVDGRLYEFDDLGCEFYRDPKGEARLALLLNRLYDCDTMVLSLLSSHPAREIPHSFRSVRTTSGLGLDSTRGEIVRALGPPSKELTYQNARVLWYLTRPEEVARSSDLDRTNHRGYANAFALRHDRVVEIMLHAWTTEIGG